MYKIENKLFHSRKFIPFFIGVLPIIFSWVYKEFISPRQPWGYFDHFETLYYSLGIVLSDGIFSGHGDNPAAPLQIISALLVSISGKLPTEYEDFLFYAHFLVLLSILFGCYLLVMKFFNEFSVICMITAIWIYFISPSSIQFTHYWGPEALYFLFAIFFFIQLKTVIESDKKLNFKSFFYVGFLLGICLSEKFIFLAWIPALVCGLSVRYYQEVSKTKLVKILFSSISGIMFGFIIVTPFLWDQYPTMFRWIANIILRDGSYGSGELSSPSLSTMITNWSVFFLNAKLWTSIIIMFLSLLVYCHIKENHFNDLKTKNINSAYLIFFLVANSFSLLSVARGVSPRYLLPVGLTIILLFYMLSRTQTYKKKHIQVGIFSIVFMLLIKQVMFDISLHDQREESTKRFQNAVNQQLNKIPNRDNLVIVYSFRFPTASYSLRQHQWREQHQLVLDRYYKNEGYYNIFTINPYVRLPIGQKYWDVLVIRKKDLQSFPEAIGEIFAEIDGYAIVLASDIHSRHQFL